MTLPNFLVIGAMRSGTSSLRHYLSVHPEIFMASVKEVHFFDRHFDLGVEWYRSHFADARSSSAVGEATQTYMYDERALPRMADVLPGAKLIAILRNPVDRAYSHYWLNRALQRESLSFAEAVAAERDRLADGDERARFRHSYIDRGRYERQLTTVCERYSREALLVVLFEELRDSPVTTYRTICRFLGVDEGFAPDDLGQRINMYTTFRSVKLRDATRGLPRPARNLVAHLNTKGSSYPPMEAGVRSLLLDTFRADNDALAEWLKRDLSIWMG